MSRRRTRRTLNEELLAEGPREADPEASAAHEEERHEAPPRLMRPALWIVGALVLLSLHWIGKFLPPWVQIIAGTLVVAHYFSMFTRSTRRRSVGAAKGLRIVLLVWLAVCVVVTVLVAIGDSDRALLGLVWPILGLIWIGYRLCASRGRGDEPQEASTDDDHASVLLGPGRAPTPSR